MNTYKVLHDPSLETGESFGTYRGVKLEETILKEKEREMLENNFIIPVIIKYNWKDSGWKTLNSFPASYIQYELDKLINLYSPEYKFKIQ